MASKSQMPDPAKQERQLCPCGCDRLLGHRQIIRHLRKGPKFTDQIYIASKERNNLLSGPEKVALGIESDNGEASSKSERSHSSTIRNQAASVSSQYQMLCQLTIMKAWRWRIPVYLGRDYIWMDRLPIIWTIHLPWRDHVHLLWDWGIWKVWEKLATRRVTLMRIMVSASIYLFLVS